MSAIPLFILSAPRSGSTLLRYILDTHSQIASPGEIGIGELCKQLQRVIDGTMGEAAHTLTQEERAALVTGEVRRIVDGIMGSYLEVKGKRIWCDKTVHNLRRLDVVAAVFPEARFVCLYRDSLDFVSSCLECSRQGFMHELSDWVVRQPHNLIAAMLNAWVDYAGMLLDFEQRHAERCFRVRYEDLVSEPEAVLRPLLAFAAVDWEEDLLASVFTTRHDQGGGDLKILFATRIDPSSVGNGRRLDLTHVPRATTHAAEETSARLSYPPFGPDRQLVQPASAERDAAAGVATSGRELIEACLEKKLGERAGLATTIQGSCRLVLGGQGGGSWRLDFGGGAPTIGLAEGVADCCLFFSSIADLEDIIAGRSNPVAAIWAGKVTVEGDLSLAQKIGELLYPTAAPT